MVRNIIYWNKKGIITMIIVTKEDYVMFAVFYILL